MASEESSGGQKKVDKADSEGDTEENSLGIPKAEFLVSMLLLLFWLIK